MKNSSLIPENSVYNEYENNVVEIWEKNNFRLGIPIIDLQHIWLIHLIVKMEFYSKGDMARETLNSVIIQTIEFLIEHYSTEERLFQIIQFPNPLSHTRTHRNYVEQLKHIHKKSSESIYKVANRILVLLNNWLYKHILDHDHKYKEFIEHAEVDIYKCNHELVSHVNISKEQVRLYQRITKDYTIKNEIINKNLIGTIRDIWKTYNLSIQIPIIDMQHLWLVKMFVELDLASRTMASIDRMEMFKKTMVRSLQYAKEHFATEELLMKEFGYPRLTIHSEKHSKFTKFLKKRNEEYKKNDLSAAFNLVQNLKDWLYSHIALDDKSLRNFFHKDIIAVNQFVKQLNVKGMLKLHNGQVALYQEFYKR
ncbi:MAG: hemerythrin family protein [Leptospiraceae bacterium]|nr:hemerythrin family protein [Leptospiraceae bacterium]MCP5497806.1 hemerythrin family protein [Leptospiraceae bacterium]